MCAAAKAHAGDARVAEEACAALANFAVGGPVPCQRIYEAGGGLAALAAMGSHGKRGVVLQEGCAALANLTQHAAAAEQLAAAGAGRVIAGAMSEHLGNERLQIFGVLALDNLGYSGLDLDEQSEASGGGGGGGGLSSVAAARKAERLKRTQLDVAAAEPLAAPLRVCAAMNAHPSSAKLQELCCRALANMAADGEGGRRAIAQSGGLALVCAAIGLHSEHPGVARRGCSALGNMAAGLSLIHI